jgi:hypothetical protein
MADSAARIAEIKHALTSTGKSVSAYSQRCVMPPLPPLLCRCRCRCDARARGPSVGADTRAARSFAAGEAPEQLQARGATQAEGGGLALSEDETHAFLEQLATLAKVRAAIARRLVPAARGRTAGARANPAR